MSSKSNKNCGHIEERTHRQTDASDFVVSPIWYYAIAMGQIIINIWRSFFKLQ